MHLEHPHTDSREYGHIWGTATGQPSTCRFVCRLPHTLLRHAPTRPQMLTPLNPQITPRYSATSPLPSYVGRMGRHCSVLCVHAQHSHRPDGSIDTNLSPKWTRSSTPPPGPRDWMSRIVLTFTPHTPFSSQSVETYSQLTCSSQQLWLMKGALCPASSHPAHGATNFLVFPHRPGAITCTSTQYPICAQ